MTLNTDSAAFTREGETYTPSTSLALAADASEITLPPDFAELSRIICTDNRSIRFFPSQSEREDWINLQQDSYDDLGNVQDHNGVVYYYDFVDARTLRLNPPLGAAIDIEIDYIPMRRPLYYSSAGVITLTNSSTTLTGTNSTWTDDGITTEAADAELIIGANNLQSNIIRVDKDYPRIVTVSSNTAALFRSDYSGATASGVGAILAMCPALPREYHRWISRLTSSLMLSKVNPDLADKLMARFLAQFREQINPVIRRRQSQESLAVEGADLD